MTIATINRIVGLFSDAFRDLSAQVPMADIERMAVLVHHSMEHGRRVYHTSAHLFDMVEEMDSRQTLAILFHDLVYYQLDGGFPLKVRDLLMKVVSTQNGKVIIRQFDDRDFDLILCTRMFGFKSGDTLPIFGGMNEFLSAVVAIRLLKAYLHRRDLIAIAAYIEGTIPFRDEKTFERLAAQVMQVSDVLAVGLESEDVECVIKDAVVIANRDVASFSFEDPSLFLSATWQLIEESNAPLNAVGMYYIRQYRDALIRMEKFLTSLNPEHVFHRYQNVPGEQIFTSLQAHARLNHAFSVSYLDVKIVAMALVEALAIETGGDCPVSMLLGDVKSHDGIPDRVENFLPPIESEENTDAALLFVLDKGRARKSIYDLAESPLTAYVCRFEGIASMTQLILQARDMFAGNLTTEDFLHVFKPQLISAVAGACAQIAISRTEALRQIETKFSSAT